jgi:hypothetical protein
MRKVSVVAHAPQRAVGDVLLVDVPTGGTAWAQRLGPCPRGATVTVLFSDPATRRRDGQALEALGYRAVGVLARPEAPGVQLAVGRAIAEAHPQWWASLLRLASQVWDTAFGPVALATAAALRAHGIAPPA